MWVICCGGKKKGKSPSVNLQMKPFSIRLLHLICSQKEHATFPPSLHVPRAGAVSSNLINILFTVCVCTRAADITGQRKPRCGNISSGISYEWRSDQPLPLSVKTKHDLRNLKAIKRQQSGELSSDVRCGLCRRFHKSSSDYIDECLEGPVRAQHLQPAEALILNPSKVPLIFLKDLYGF